MRFCFPAWTFFLFIFGSAAACRRSDSVTFRMVETAPAGTTAETREKLPEPAPPEASKPAEPAPPAPQPDPIESMTVPAEPVARARLYFEMGYGFAAFQVLSALPPEERKKPENRLLEGLAAEMCGRFRDAAEACADAEAMPDEKSRVEALLCQGRVWMQLKDFKLSAQKFREAHEMAPRDPSTALSLMDALVTLNDGPGLLRLTKKILASDPGDAAAQLYLGIALEMASRRDEADAAFAKLMNNDAVPAYLEAAAFDRRGLLWAKVTPERAREILEQCRKRFPSYGCPRTEVAISPPDPRHPNRKIHNVTRPGRYGTAPLPQPPP